MFWMGVWTGFWLALAWDAWITSLYERPLPPETNGVYRVRFKEVGPIGPMPYWPRDGGP